jgi:hypothetical protein
LDIPDTKTAILAEPDDILAGGNGIDDREIGLLHSVSPPISKFPKRDILE